MAAAFIIAWILVNFYLHNNIGEWRLDFIVEIENKYPACTVLSYMIAITWYFNYSSLKAEGLLGIIAAAWQNTKN